MLQLPTIEELKQSKVNLVICSDKEEVKRVLQLLKATYSYWKSIDGLYDLTNPEGMDEFVQTALVYDYLLTVGVIDCETARNSPELEAIKTIAAVWEEKGEQET